MENENKLINRYVLNFLAFRFILFPFTTEYNKNRNKDSLKKSIFLFEPQSLTYKLFSVHQFFKCKTLTRIYKNHCLSFVELSEFHIKCSR